MDEQHPPPEVSRRLVLRSVAVAGVGVPLFAACGSETDVEVSGSGSDDGTAPSPSDASGSPAESPTAGGGTTVATADVPVGGGTIFPDEMVVVTQPTAGEFLAFSAVCTHAGCPVAAVSDGTINCQCHGSSFSIEDGSVVNGPATKPLESRDIAVEGDQLRLG